MLRSGTLNELCKLVCRERWCMVDAFDSQDPEATCRTLQTAQFWPPDHPGHHTNRLLLPQDREPERGRRLGSQPHGLTAPKANPPLPTVPFCLLASSFLLRPNKRILETGQITDLLSESKTYICRRIARREARNRKYWLNCTIDRPREIAKRSPREPPAQPIRFTSK